MRSMPPNATPQASGMINMHQPVHAQQQQQQQVASGQLSQVVPVNKQSLRKTQPGATAASNPRGALKVSIGRAPSQEAPDVAANKQVQASASTGPQWMGQQQQATSNHVPVRATPAAASQAAVSFVSTESPSIMTSSGATGASLMTVNTTPNARHEQQQQQQQQQHCSSSATISGLTNSQAHTMSGGHNRAAAVAAHHHAAPGGGRPLVAPVDQEDACDNLSECSCSASSLDCSLDDPTHSTSSLLPLGGPSQSAINYHQQYQHHANPVQPQHHPHHPHHHHQHPHSNHHNNHHHHHHNHHLQNHQRHHSHQQVKQQQQQHLYIGNQQNHQNAPRQQEHYYDSQYKPAHQHHHNYHPDERLYSRTSNHRPLQAHASMPPSLSSVPRAPYDAAAHSTSPPPPAQQQSFRHGGTYAANSDTITDDSPFYRGQRQQAPALNHHQVQARQPGGGDEYFQQAAAPTTTNETDPLIADGAPPGRYHLHSAPSGKQSVNFKPPDNGHRWPDHGGGGGGQRQQAHSSSDATNTLSLERKHGSAYPAAGVNSDTGGSLQRSAQSNRRPNFRSTTGGLSNGGHTMTRSQQADQQQQQHQMPLGGNHNQLTGQPSTDSAFDHYTAYQNQSQQGQQMLGGQAPPAQGYTRAQSSLSGGAVANNGTGAGGATSNFVPVNNLLLSGSGANSASAPTMPHSVSPFEAAATVQPTFCPPILPPPPPALPVVPPHRTNSPWMRLSGIILTPVGIVIVLFIVISPLLHYLM